MSLKMRCQRGFTTITLMGVLMAGGLLVAAGFAAVDPDIGLSKQDHDFKQAYAAAEAGINYYLYHLGQDNNLYNRCDNIDPPNDSENNPITQRWTTPPSATPPTGGWRKLPGEKAEYNIELMPARSYSACQPNRQETMIDPATGSFRIRANGRVPKAGGGYVKRSVIATLRRKSFIDFLYFTAYETSDPVTYGSPAAEAWAWANCAERYRAARHSSCREIQFADDDVIAGPFHTNDDVITCRRPTFGRTRNDAIEFGGRSPGWSPVCGASYTPDFQGTRVWPGGTLPMPPTNQELQSIADDDYVFNGTTVIELLGSSMRVTNGGTTNTMDLPENGVVYVGSLGCPGGYTYKQEYRSPSTCGDVWVKGNYSEDLTIAAANDIIVYDNVTRNSAGLLMGLVADNFVRVYHPVRNWRNSSTDCDDSPDSADSGSSTGKFRYFDDPSDHITIQSAILALKHSFIVDNYYCGGDLGTLTVDGAIGQMYRGPVGTTGGTGYEKNYIYNDRLRYREPPFFIDPVQSAWQIVRQNEQIPAH